MTPIFLTSYSTTPHLILIPYLLLLLLRHNGFFLVFECSKHSLPLGFGETILLLEMVLPFIIIWITFSVQSILKLSLISPGRPCMTTCLYSITLVYLTITITCLSLYKIYLQIVIFMKSRVIVSFILCWTELSVPSKWSDKDRSTINNFKLERQNWACYFCLQSHWKF